MGIGLDAKGVFCECSMNCLDLPESCNIWWTSKDLFSSNYVGFANLIIDIQTEFSRRWKCAEESVLQASDKARVDDGFVLPSNSSLTD